MAPKRHGDPVETLPGNPVRKTIKIARSEWPIDSQEATPTTVPGPDAIVESKDAVETMPHNAVKASKAASSSLPISCQLAAPNTAPGPDARAQSEDLVYAEWVEDGPEGYNHSRAPCHPLSCNIPAIWRRRDGKRIFPCCKSR